MLEGIFGYILAVPKQCGELPWPQQNGSNYRNTLTFLDDKSKQSSQRLNVGYFALFSASLVRGETNGEPRWTPAFGLEPVATASLRPIINRTG